MPGRINGQPMGICSTMSMSANRFESSAPVRGQRDRTARLIFTGASMVVFSALIACVTAASVLYLHWR